MSFIQGVKGATDFVTNNKAKYLDGYSDKLSSKFLLSTRNVQGISGFLFDYEGESSSSFDAEITDHYLEDNSVIHDHVALKPERVVLRGFVGELVMRGPGGLAGLLGALNSKLSTVEAYIGGYTPQQLQKVQSAIAQAQNAVNTIDQSLARVNNVVSFLSGASQPTKQQTAYTKLRSLWAARAPFSVRTPYGVYKDMLIERVTLTQYEDAKSHSDVVVTMKQINFVSVAFTGLNLQGRAAAQRQPLAYAGPVLGSSAAQSDVSGAFQ